MYENPLRPEPKQNKGLIIGLSAAVAVLLVLVIAFGAGALLGDGDDAEVGAPVPAAKVPSEPAAAPVEPSTPAEPSLQAEPSEPAESAQPAESSEPAQPAEPGAGGMTEPLADPCAALAAGAQAAGATLEGQVDESSRNGEVIKACRFDLTTESGAYIPGGVEGTTSTSGAASQEVYEFNRSSDTNGAGLVTEPVAALPEGYLVHNAKPNGGGGYSITVGARDGNLVVSSKLTISEDVPLAEGKELAQQLAQSYLDAS